MTTHTRPDRNNRNLWFCAYCNYWEGECGLKLHGTSMVEFDERAKGKCTKTGNQRPAGQTACRDFEFSQYASKYKK